MQAKPGILRRLAAILYDSLLILALLILLAFIWVGISRTFDIPAAWGLRIIAIGLLMGFYWFFWAKKGQTLGMTTWRLKIRSNRGGQPNNKQLIIRLLSAGLSIACLGLGFLWMLVDKDKLTWHDRISNTWLELLPKKT